MPSKSELQVSIWRLTNQRQVWYEWYAEAFLSLPDASPLVSVTSPPRQEFARLQVPGAGERVAIEGSPFIDNVEMPETPVTPRTDAGGYYGSDSSEIRLVKIGQTSLHNPAGRSSWIGL